MNLSPLPIQKFFDNNGKPLDGGQLFTYVAGTTTKIATYKDQAGTLNTNPIVLDYRGEANVWLDPTLTYKFTLAPVGDTDPPTKPIWTIDNISAALTYASLTRIIIGTLLFPQTAAELAAGVTPLNYYVPSDEAVGFLNPLRYGVNTTPGTTDMSAAIQTCITIALAALGAGKQGIPVRIPNGAYSIGTALTFGSVTVSMIPIVIEGEGLGTQLINNLAAGTAPTLNMSGKDGWIIRNLLICGNTVHKNDGIWIDGSTTASIRWQIDNVVSMMPGYGIKMTNTNTGVVNRFRSWPNNPPSLIVAQTVTLTDINHHIYCTGGFINNVTLQDCDCLPSSVYIAGQRGIKLDATFSHGVSIIGGDFESNAGLNTETGIDIQPTSTASGMLIQGVYHEGTTISLKNVANSVIGPTMNGFIGGSIVLVTTCTNNLFQGIRVATWNVQDPTDSGNTIIGCVFSAFTDSSDAPNQSVQPNRYIGCNFGGSGIADRGTNWRKILAWSASITPDTYSARTFVIRVPNGQAGTAFTINAPSHIYNGQEVILTVRNETGGALGVITWSGINQAGWVNPANGFNRSMCIYYDQDFTAWRMAWVTTADVPN